MNRDSLLPLSISALLAVCLHASVVLWYGLWPGEQAKAATVQLDSKPILPDPTPPPTLPKPPEPPEPPKPEKPKPPEPKPKPEPEPAPAKAQAPKPLEIGRDGEPVRSTIAWIPYDDFKKLMAPESLTIQPALQTQADPLAGAPVEINPSVAKPTPTTILTHSRTQQDEQAEQAKQPEQSDSSLQPLQSQPPVVAQVPAKSTDTSAATIVDQPSQTPPPTKPTAPSEAASAGKTDQTPAQAQIDATKPPAGIAISKGSDLPDVTSQPDTSAATPILPQANADESAKPDSKPIESDVAAAEPANNQTKPTEPDNRLALAPFKRVDPIEAAQDQPTTSPTTRPAKPDVTPTPDQPVRPTEPTESTEPAKPVQPPKPATSAASASESNEDRPTSVPRSDRESIATQTTPMPDQIVLGRVLVSDGIEIKTVRPRFNISTLFTATPRNPVATIVFDKTGQVVRAELVLSSGFADIDSPILNSLYRWRASGKKLEDHKSATFTIHNMKLLLVDDRKEEASPQTKTDAPSRDDSPDSSPQDTTPNE